VQVLVALKLASILCACPFCSEGTGMGIRRSTNKLRMDQQYFMIPATLLFWGCPAHVSSHVR
jgi:hypothetical protein